MKFFNNRRFSLFATPIAVLAVAGCVAMLTGCNQPAGNQIDTKTSVPVAGENAPGPKPATGDGGFSLEARFQQCGMDSLRIYLLEGGGYRPMAAAAFEQQNGVVRAFIDGDLPAQGFYMIGQAPNNLTTIVLGAEKNVQISGNCNDFRQGLQIDNSPINQQLQTVSQRFSLLQQQSQNAINVLRIPNSDPAAQRTARQQIREIFDRQVSLYDSVKKANPFLGKVLALNLYRPFDPDDNPKNHASELVHYGKEYMAYADLRDPEYDYIPLTNYHLTNYVSNLFGGAVPQEEAKGYLNALLARFDESSVAYKNALVTTLQTLDQMRATAYLDYGNLFLKKFPGDQQLAAAIRNRNEVYKAEAENEKRLSIGAIPPEINMPTPEGKNLKLSSLRGKVVLLDFWAAWCRPCRMENPNVVRLYNKYKGQGFDVFSVSLDRDRNAWLKAIEDDKMTWKHVSEVKYWDSQAARDYRVSAIPATFLLDRDGKIIGKNLRGMALEQKLAEIFSNSR